MPEAKENLLIVDDEPSIRATLSWALTDFGYPVRTAEDGFSALIEIRKQIPDIVLSDLNMPGMSGFEFLSVIRRRFPSIPLIAMSGAFRGDEASSGIAADAFFQKGSGLRALLKILEELPRPVSLDSTPQGTPLDSTKRTRCLRRVLRYDRVP